MQRLRHFSWVMVLVGLAFVLPMAAQAQGEPSPGLDAQAELPRENEILVQYGASPQLAFDAQQPLKVFNWNVHKFDNAKTFQQVRAVAQKADILIVQESMMNAAAQNFFEKFLNNFETLGAISFFTEGREGTGVSTSSRVQAWRALPIRSREVEPVLKTPKMILIKEFKLVDRAEVLAVANIHGLNFVPNWKFQVQLDQLESALAEHRGPIILAGDFNTHNLGKGMMVHQMAQRLGLQYVWMDNNNGARLQLDHMFVRGFSRQKARVMTELESSDHFPLWAELKFQ